MAKTTATLSDAEGLLAALVEQMRPQVNPRMALVGIHTGGVWLAERLHTALAVTLPAGSIDVSFYRDDFASRGLRPGTKTSFLPFDVEGADIVIVDDVLYTGRTIRAALNELFDYGRPARVDLAVLVDRGGRELPIAARYCAQKLAQPLPASQELVLGRAKNNSLAFTLKDKGDA